MIAPCVTMGWSGVGPDPYSGARRFHFFAAHGSWRHTDFSPRRVLRSCLRDFGRTGLHGAIAASGRPIAAALWLEDGALGERGAMKIRMPSKQAVATMRFGLTVVAQHVARAKQPGDAESKRLASARGKEGHAGAAQRAGGDRARHDFQCAIGAFVPVEDRNRMGRRCCGDASRRPDRDSSEIRPAPGLRNVRIDRQDARAWQTTRQDLVGRDQRCGDVEAAYWMANAAPAKGSRDSVENKRWSVGQSPAWAPARADRVPTPIGSPGGSILAVGARIGGNWNRGGAVVLAQGEANRRGDTCSSLEQVSPFYADPAMPSCGRKAASAGSCHRAVGRGEWRRLRGSPRQWPASMPERRGCR